MSCGGLSSNYALADGNRLEQWAQSTVVEQAQELKLNIYSGVKVSETKDVKARR